MWNIKNNLSLQARAIIISIAGGLLLIFSWLFVNHLRAEPVTAQVQVAENPDLLQSPKDSTKNGTQPLQQQPDTSPNIPATVTPATPVVTAANPGPYKNGTYQATSPTPWGDYTISITVKNGQWNNVNNITVPDSPPSKYAASILANQALQTQNANIDGVSGATYVSDAFRDDLTQIVQQSKI